MRRGLQCGGAGGASERGSVGFGEAYCLVPKKHSEIDCRAASQTAWTAETDSTQELSSGFANCIKESRSVVPTACIRRLDRLKSGPTCFRGFLVQRGTAQWSDV